MTDLTLRARLAEHAVTGRFTAFVAAGAALALVGLGLFAMAAGGEGADRAWHLFHVNWLFFTGLAGGSIALAAVHRVANAKWSGLIVRFAEAAVAFFPVSFLGLIAIFTVGYEPIYGPMEHELHGLSHGKALWLSHGWMFGRLALGLAVLYGLGWALVRANMMPDMHEAKPFAQGRRRRLFERWSAAYDGSEATAAHYERRVRRLAPAYVVAYALVFSVLAFDAVMALQPHWFSNLLGAFYFMGSFLGAHMLLALVMMYAGRQTGVWRLISPKQRHDLGKLCFGFTVFWAYLMWSQFLVIWYGNLPEETGFVFARLWGPWLPIGRAVFVGLFLVPFIGLLGVEPKKLPLTLGLFATVSLTALWLERYLLVLPSVTVEHGPVLGLPEVGPTLAFAGLFLLSLGLFARVFPMVSPRLAEITLDRERHHTEIGEFEHEEAP